MAGNAALLDFLKALLVVGLAQTGVLIGIFFISGQLLPTTLAGIYEAVPKSVWRTVIVSALIFPLCNWAVGFAYAHYNPAIVAPLMVGSMIVLNITFTLLVLGTRPSGWMAPALLLMVGSGVWLSLLLQQKG